jgi:RNA-binding protein Musashi
MADTSYYGNSAAPAPAPKPTMDQGKIFVGGLSWQTTEESLRWHFEQYGPVQSVEVMKDRHTGDPRGFAFVVFQDGATIDLVMNEGKHEINHKVVDVKRAQARGVAPPSIHEREQAALAAQAAASNAATSSYRPNGSEGGDGGGGGDEASPEQMGNKVFVGGIPPHIDRDGLKGIFEQFGTVVDAIVMVDQVTMRSRCFGFVTFENGSNGAHRSIEAQPLSVQGRNVEVKLATPRAEQKRVPPAGPKHVGLRAGQSSSSSGEFAGLAVSYGRSGWKAGYGSRAFGKGGWAVQGWEDGGPAPERAGFSFDMLRRSSASEEQPPAKRSRH